MDEFQPDSQELIAHCRKIAQDFLGSRFGSEAVYETDTSPIVYGIGHCHIGQLHGHTLESQVTD
jgi:alpha-mannosidase